MIMIKFFLILFLIFFIVTRVIGVFFNILFPQSQSSRRNFNRGSYNNTSRKTGEVNIDYMPNKAKKERKMNGKGGEYIDYEEVE